MTDNRAMLSALPPGDSQPRAERIENVVAGVSFGWARPRVCPAGVAVAEPGDRFDENGED